MSVISVKVGDTVTDQGTEFIVNRISPVHNKGELTRLQIDCIAVADAVQRRDSLNDLLKVAGIEGEEA